jgi:type II secretory pathway predicted ATPase ExeA
MYESFFGFRQRPFLAVPTLDRYFPASSMEQAIAAVTRCVQRGEGPAAMIGGAGLGKTMCCLRLAQHFSKQFDVVVLASSQICTRRALLQCLLYELRLPYHNRSEGELRLALNQRLLPNPDRPSEGLVLIVDEAQTLSTKLLDELRLITNVVHQGVPRVRLVLCGTMKLEDLLAHPHSESLNQRIASRSYLVPLSGQETGQYIRHKLEISGGLVSDVMTDDAIDALYRGSDGIPRLIDQLSDHALWSASQLKIKPLNASIVGHAWSTLQQLPNPWSEPVAPTFAPATSSTRLSVQPGIVSGDRLVASNRTAADGAIPSSLNPTLPSRVAYGVEFGSLDDTESTASSTAAADAHSPVASRLHAEPMASEEIVPAGSLDANVSQGVALFSPQPEAPREPNRSTSLFRSFLVCDPGSAEEPAAGLTVSAPKVSGPQAASQADASPIGSSSVLDMAAREMLSHEEILCSTEETVSASVADSLSSTAIASSFIEWMEPHEPHDFATAERAAAGDLAEDEWSGLHASDLEFSLTSEQPHDAESELENELRALVSQIQGSTMVADAEAMPSSVHENGVGTRLEGETSSAMVRADDRDMIIIEDGIQHVTVSIGKQESSSARPKPSVFAKWF